MKGELTWSTDRMIIHREKLKYWEANYLPAPFYLP
jgi:hypothetical protein